MLELAKNLLSNEYDAHKVMEILINGGIGSLEAAQIVVEALQANSADLIAEIEATKDALDGKIEMKSIQIIWHEGTGEFDGKIFADWNEFNDTLAKIAVQHGGSLGYSKTKFLLTWNDGETYEGRLDVNAEDDLNVEQHILDHLTFYTGERCPDHMTEQEYKSYIDSIVTVEEQKGSREYLNRYNINDLIISLV